jgi:RNA methyltransferase, TrmH family
VRKIVSADNPRFKALLKLLQSSRERRRAGLSLLDGIHLVTAYRDNLGPPQQVVISMTGLHDPEIGRILARLDQPETLLLSDELFNRLSSVNSPTGIIAVVSTPLIRTVPSNPGPCVLLDGIQDPGNLGSILRSVAASGLHEVFMSEATVHSWSPRVLRAGMGAHFHLNIYERVDLLSLIKNFRGRVIATSSHLGKPVFQADLTGNIALLFGNEGAGISQQLIAVTTELVTIPMPGKIESLNVAAAAAICLFERTRQAYDPKPAAVGWEGCTAAQVDR